jgi:serine/threonine-protein kinase
VVGFAGWQAQEGAGGGGAPPPCATSDARGGSFGPDDTIVFTPGNFSGLARVSANGGTPATLTTPDESAGERTHRWPQVLPGGRGGVVTVGIARGTR